LPALIATHLRHFDFGIRVASINEPALNQGAASLIMNVLRFINWPKSRIQNTNRESSITVGVSLASVKPRIHIIGGPGSGKSYVAAKLARCLGVPAYELDELFWDRASGHYAIRADPAKRDEQLAAIVAQDGWVIEGVYYQWLTPSFSRADVIIVLTPSIWIRHWRVIRRFFLRKVGRVSPRRESFADLWSLLRWSHGYEAAKLAEARKLVTEHGRRLIECKTFADVLAVTETPNALQPIATGPRVLD
jgi:adenylate kinase family enzyme